MIREIKENEYHSLLELYLDLHEKKIPNDDERFRAVWEKTINDEDHHIIVCVENDRIVSSCVCVIVPNLTRNLRPYALIENVVTDKDYRGQGYASRCLQKAVEIAQSQNCYKVMLLTGAKDEKTLRFYQKAGFNCDDKTAFIRWL